MPGPNRSILNAHVKEIAELRKKIPPTSYEEIRKYLKEKHGIVIRASSIWAFVKARSIEGKRKLRYVIAEEAIQTGSGKTDAPLSSTPSHTSTTNQPESPAKDPEVRYEPGERYRKALEENQPKTTAEPFDENRKIR